MSEQRSSAPSTERTFRTDLFRKALWISAVSLGVFVPIYAGLGYVVPAFPGLPLAVLCGLGAAACWPVWETLRRGHHQGALVLYLVVIHGVFAGVIYLTGGIFSPLMPAFPALVVFAAILGGAREALGSSLAALLTVAGLTVLDAMGQISTLDIEGLPRYLVINLLFFTVLAVTNLLLLDFERTKYALVEAEERQDRLAEAMARAEASASAEREASQREAALSQNLQDVMRQYTRFLQQVTEGNYQVRLEVDRLGQDKDLPPELIALGDYLNTTVEGLVSAVTEMEEAQQMYTSQSWDAYTRRAAAARGYRYRAAAEGEGQIESDDWAWLAAMQDAVQQHRLAVGDAEIAVPLDMRGQIIGAIGMRREAEADWGEDEKTLIRAITDQLAQTIDNLRLLEDTGRRAARERTASDVAGRIRAEVEIEAVLERALLELGQVLQADRGMAHLSLGEQEEE